MGFFNKKSPQEKLDNFLDKYGLKIEDYSSEQLKELNVKNLKRIHADLAGKDFTKATIAFSFTKPEEHIKVSYLSALVEQGWIQIRQNEIIIKGLQKLNGNN